MPNPVALNATQIAAPSRFSVAPPTQTLLVSQLSSIRQGMQHLTLPDHFGRAGRIGTPVAKGGIVFPAYGGEDFKTPCGYIQNQASYDSTCAFVVEYLKTHSLSEQEMLGVLKSGLLQTPTGKALAELFVDAMMRSIQPKGDLTRQQLFKIVHTICTLPPSAWVYEFGERLGFSKGANVDGVAGFIQWQLELSRFERLEKIESGELLADKPWEEAKAVIKNCRSSIRPWDKEDRLNLTLCKLEEYLDVRPSPEHMKFLLGEFLQRSNEPRRERFPDRHLRAVKELWERIELPRSSQDTLPELLRAGVQGAVKQTNSALNTLGAASVKDVGNVLYSGGKSVIQPLISLANFMFRAPPQKEASIEGDFPLLSRLEEIHRKGDSYSHVITRGPTFPKGWVARLMYAGYLVHEASNIVASFRPSAPPLHFTPDPGKRDCSSTSLSEQLLQFGQQIDQLLSQAIKALSGWHPVKAVEMAELKSLLSVVENIRDSLERARHPQSHSSPNPEGPYALTVEPVEQQQRLIQTLYSELGAWLRTAADWVVGMGVATFKTMTGTARQHPRAAATLAMAAMVAAVNEFYSLRAGGVTGGSLFTAEEDAGLRGEILNEVETVLSAMPSVDEAIRGRLAHSTYEEPRNDPRLVDDVARLLEEPVAWNPNITSAELIFTLVDHVRKDRFQYHDFASFNVDESTTKPDRSKHSKRAAQWALEAVYDPGALSTIDKQLQSNLVTALASGQDTAVSISAGTLIHDSVELYKQAVNDKAVLDFFTAQHLDLSTLRIHHRSVTGYVSDNGRTTLRTFDLWDDSGWWPAAKSLLPVLQLLDPDDQGLCHVSTGSNTLARDVVLAFYGVSAPTSIESAKQLASELSTSGWPEFSAGKKARLEKALEQVKQGAEETTERAQFVAALEEVVKDKADNATVNLSAIMADFVSTPLMQSSQEVRHHLNDFLALLPMIELCEAQKIDCSAFPARISEQKIQVFVEDKWADLTGAVNAQPALKVDLDKLLEQVKKTGNALYTSTSCDLLQITQFAGFDAPKSAGQVRNILRWLTTLIPPSPPLGNYGADLLVGASVDVTLSNAEKARIIELGKELLDESPSIIHTLGSDLLSGTSVAHRRAHADRLFTQMFATDTADSWGQRLLETLDWYGASKEQTACKAHYHQLLCTAIKLGVDPDAPGKFGNIAGYDVYQPKNNWRDLAAIRTDIENHLINNKGVSAQTAPLVAHLFLADVAPEFLVPGSGSPVPMGSFNWMTLRLGAAIAEATNKGSSRVMTAEQLMALATLDPASGESRVLFQSLGVDTLVAWGVMNGVVRVRTTSTYSPGDYEHAAKSFARQRAELTASIQNFSRPLQSRREMAIIELRNVFPGASDSKIEGMKLWSKGLGPKWNAAATEGTTHDLVEVYMSGDLNPEDWWQPSREGLKQELWASRVRALPDLNKLLTASVDSYFADFSKAFIAPTKLVFAQLPLEDRQSLELGTVELFTLREETGRIKEDETPELQAAVRGGYGTLIRCEYRNNISYFEVFPAQMKIVKRTDLPDELSLDGVINVEKVKLSKGSPVNADVQRGKELRFDFLAYSTGSAPRSNVTSPRLIIEKLGSTFAATSLVGYADETAYVPPVFFSPKMARIINAVINDNFLVGQKAALFDSAKGLTPRDKQKQFWDCLKGFALQLIPFVGCVKDVSSGTRIGLINGAFGCFADSVSSLFGLVGGATKAVGVVKSISPVRIKAFELINASLGTAHSIINPLSGLPDLIQGTVKGIRGLGRMLTSCVFEFTQSGIARLQTGVDQARTFLGGAATTAGKNLPGWANADQGFLKVTHRGANITATLKNNKWYGVDYNGKPFGPPLTGVTPLNP